MIWNLIIIIAIVFFIAIIIRKIPLAKKFLKEEEPEMSEEEITIMSTLAHADDAFERKNYLKAEQLYIKAAAIEPKNAKIFSRLGAIYLENENYYDAKEAFLQVVKIDQNNPSYYTNLGLAYLGLKDYYKAEQAFLKSVKMDPKNKKYQELLDKARNK